MASRRTFLKLVASTPLVAVVTKAPPPAQEGAIAFPPYCGTEWSQITAEPIATTVLSKGTTIWTGSVDLASANLPKTAQALADLILDLRARGLIGA